MSAQRLSDMTRDDLKLVVKEILDEAIQEFLWELEQQMPDPDEGLTLRADVVESLLHAQREKRRGTPLDDVVRELGLDE